MKADVPGVVTSANDRPAPEPHATRVRNSFIVGLCCRMSL
jgi:hypothetical protein